jgi:hypothetical protein
MVGHDVYVTGGIVGTGGIDVDQAAAVVETELAVVDEEVVDVGLPVVEVESVRCIWK